MDLVIYSFVHLELQLSIFMKKRYFAYSNAIPLFVWKNGNGIAVFKVALPHEYAQLYFQLYKSGNDKIHARKKVAKEQQNFVASRLDHATQSLISEKRIKPNHEISEVSVTSSNVPNALGFVSVGWSNSTNNV